MRMHHFWTQNDPFAPNENLFRETINCNFYLPLDPFHCAKFEKKYLGQIQSYEDVPFLDRKWPDCPEREFFQKTYYLTLLHSFMFIYMQKTESDVIPFMR